MDDHEAINRYSSQYEANLDPFAAFGAKVHSVVNYIVKSVWHDSCSLSGEAEKVHSVEWY